MPVTRVSGLPLPVAAPSSPFVTSVHSSKRYILDQFGQPIFMMGDSAWGLAGDISTTDMTTYFSTRQSQGFNSALVVLVADVGIWTANAQTFDGINCFTGTVAGGYPDLTTPNATYWARVDSMVALAATYGITLMLVPANTSPLDNTYMMAAARANGGPKCVSYGNFLGNRYKNSPNVFWMHGNDYNANASDDVYVAGIMQGIQAVDATVLNTVEYTQASTSSYSLQATSVWVNGIQLDQVYPTASDHAIYNIEASAYAASPTMPSFMGEWIYEGENSSTNFLLRNSEYWGMCTGTLGGYYYGNHVVWPFSTGWQSNLATSMVTELGYWASLFRSLSWWKLLPDTGNTFLTGGIGSGNTQSVGAVAADGSVGVVYCPNTNPVIAMTKMRGTTNARWYDPTLGTFTTIGSFSNTGSQTFTLPGAAHSDGNGDYVLVLTA